MVRSGWAMVRLKLKVLVTTPASVPIPTPFLCAVSFGYEHAIRSFPKHKTANSCPGAAAGNCYPYWRWSSLPSGTSSEEYWGYGLESGNFVDNSRAYVGTYAYTVRCVLDLISTDSCPGSTQDSCFPNYIWSGTLTTAGTNAYDRELATGNFIENAWVPHIITHAFSVRCLLLARYPATYGADEISPLSSQAAGMLCPGFEHKAGVKHFYNTIPY